MMGWEGGGKRRGQALQSLTAAVLQSPRVHLADQDCVDQCVYVFFFTLPHCCFRPSLEPSSPLVVLSYTHTVMNALHTHTAPGWLSQRQTTHIVWILATKGRLEARTGSQSQAGH